MNLIFNFNTEGIMHGIYDLSCIIEKKNKYQLLTTNKSIKNRNIINIILLNYMPSKLFSFNYTSNNTENKNLVKNLSNSLKYLKINFSFRIFIPYNLIYFESNYDRFIINKKHKNVYYKSLLLYKTEFK